MKKLNISFDEVPMNVGRNYMFPTEILMLFGELGKEEKYADHLLNLKFLLWTGVRYMEGTGVADKDIFDYGFVQLLKTKSKHKKGESKSGGGKIRQKKLTQEQIKELKKYAKKKKLLRTEPLFTYANTTLNRVITKTFIKLKHPFYEHLTTVNGKIINKNGGEAEAPFTCHAFRRTNLNFRIALDEDIEVITKESGHTMKVCRESYLSANLFSIQDKWLCDQLLYH